MKLPSRGQGLRVLGFVLLIALVVPFVIYAVPGVVGAEHSYVVLSGSMTPTFGPGDAVIVNQQPTDRIERGDIISFATKGDDVPTTHRVVEIQRTDNGRAFITKGDANDVRDSTPRPADSVIGTVMFSIPYIGYVVRFASTTLGFAVLVGGPIALLVITEIIAFGRSTRTSARDETDGKEDSGGDEALPDASADDTAAGSHDEAARDTDTISITAADLRLALGVLAAFAAYSIVVAFVIGSAWSIAVAVAVVGCLGLGLALAWSARRGVTTEDGATDTESVEKSDADTAGHVTDGGRPDDEPSNEGEPS